MAAGKLPSPGKVINGEEIGPCVSECEHRDCAETRRQAACKCVTCGEEIGYETRFYQAEGVHDHSKLEHARCAEDRAELHRKQMHGE